MLRTVRISVTSSIAMTDVVGVRPCGQISAGQPVEKTKFEIFAIGVKGFHVRQMMVILGWARRADVIKLNISVVLPEFEITKSKSFAPSAPKSP